MKDLFFSKTEILNNSLTSFKVLFGVYHYSSKIKSSLQYNQSSFRTGVLVLSSRISIFYHPDFENHIVAIDMFHGTWSVSLICPSFLAKTTLVSNKNKV